VDQRVHPATREASTNSDDRRGLAERGVPPESLGLEINERHLVGAAQRAHSDLLALQDLGLRLAVDNFGAFGSFEYLRRIRVSAIKVARSFMPDSARIVRRGRGRRRRRVRARARVVVVAEGVETHRQYERAKELGCTACQGFLLHRPVPPEGIALVLGKTVKDL
jgi:EAL domain-containing protein (putative c-di-GMP-specific phosphodiesterase class I)